MVQEKKRRKVMKSSIVHELRSEYLDLPEEVHVSHMTCPAHFIHHMIMYSTCHNILSLYVHVHVCMYIQDVGRGLRSSRELKEERERET